VAGRTAPPRALLPPAVLAAGQRQRLAARACKAEAVSVELVLCFFGGILAGATASQLLGGRLDAAEPPPRATLLFAIAAAAFAAGFVATPYFTTVPFLRFQLA
jgi:hypothetical protein